MPPKRAASRAPSSARNKRARASTGSTSDEPPRSKRWAAVSGSANADADYKCCWKNPAKFYSFVTICPPLMGDEDEDDDDDDEDEDDDEEDDDEDSESSEDDDDDDDDGDDEAKDEGASSVPGGRRAGPKCGKKNCMCFKPASQHPDHPWVISQAGYRKFYTQNIHAQLRNPDNFDMHTFNDHAGYGILETVQNLFLDFNEAAERGWKEQWAVCEGMVLWLLHPSSDMLLRIDDAEGLNDTMRLVGRMFLYMLAKLDEQDLVGDATEVRSLGCIMAMYMKLATSVRDVGVLDSDNTRGTKTLQPDHFEEAVLTYANKRGVTLQGPDSIDELAAELDGDLYLPPRGADDPWGWKAEFKKYEKEHGVKGRIGGDSLDITTWSSAERKSKSFNRRDPLGKKEIDAIKQGLVMQLG